ncbi:hypothetical protein PILCRDRAFT_13346 [Piloderma croceum F 1598]|uniref:Uncharacterized protein n=1 Tax=Piloderma croceum (strain F 1598) TaxID=765440 RepID=A0A0C3AP91_PILCF|nr:hypothetical protein PILCRDRAFT_13346 [Piloderma croceum F 1598]
METDENPPREGKLQTVPPPPPDAPPTPGAESESDDDLPPAQPVRKDKSHVKRPDDFTDTKQWDKFQRQLFVYVVDNRKDFNQKDEKIIHFQLSFMMVGLPEKFTANFVDSIIDTYKKQKRYREGYMIIEPKIDWGTAYDFKERCNKAFRDQSKKVNTENHLCLWTNIYAQTFI